MKEVLLERLCQRDENHSVASTENLQVNFSLDYIENRIKDPEQELELLKNRRLEVVRNRLVFSNEHNQQQSMNANVQQEQQAMNMNMRQANQEPIEANMDNNINHDIQRMVIRENENIVPVNNNVMGPANLFTFRDIENALHTFSGNDNYHVEFFIKEFEQQATMMRWNNEQKIIYAKRLLRGQAKLLTRTIFIATWDALKKELLEEFGKKLTANEAHKLLQSTKKKNNEEIGEYALKMREIGVTNKIDDVSVVQYIVDGIDDTPINKAMLYGCESYRELKTKLEAYDKFKMAFGGKKETKTTNSNDKKTETKTSNGTSNGSSKKADRGDSRCFLCGDTNHLMSSCPTKKKGVKCFRCNIFGHKSSDNVCKKEEGKNKDDGTSCAVIEVKPKSMKKIKIGNVELTALIDTGSVINAMRNSIFGKLKNVMINSENGREFTGAGIDKEKFKTKIYIVKDNDIPVDLLIGNELLDDVELNIKKGEIRITKCNETEVKEGPEKFFLLSITLKEEDMHDKIPSEVKTMIDNYKPEKSKHTNVELKIQLTDESPI